MRSGDARRFTDREVRRILERALEIQKRETKELTPGGGAGTGLTIEDITDAAVQAGINPSLVRRAARELETGTGKGRVFLGSEPDPISSASLPYRVSDEDLRELLPMIQSFTGQAGSGTVSRLALSWASIMQSTSNTGVTTEVTVRTGRDSTEITVRDRLGAVAGGVFGGLMGGVGVGAGLGVGFGVGLGTFGSPSFAALFALGMLTVSYLGARMVFTGVARWRRRERSRALERILEFFADRRKTAERGPADGENSGGTGGQSDLDTVR